MRTNKDLKDTIKRIQYNSELMMIFMLSQGATGIVSSTPPTSAPVNVNQVNRVREGPLRWGVT